MSRPRRRARPPTTRPSAPRPRAAEPEIAVPGLGRPGVAVGRARPHEVAAAGAAAHHPPARIVIVLVRHPLPDIAAEIEHAVRAGAERVLPDRHRTPGVRSRARAFALEVS